MNQGLRITVSGLCRSPSLRTLGTSVFVVTVHVFVCHRLLYGKTNDHWRLWEPARPLSNWGTGVAFPWNVDACSTGRMACWEAKASQIVKIIIKAVCEWKTLWRTQLFMWRKCLGSQQCLVFLRALENGEEKCHVYYYRCDEKRALAIL